MEDLKDFEEAILALTATAAAAAANSSGNGNGKISPSGGRGDDNNEDDESSSEEEDSNEEDEEEDEEAAEMDKRLAGELTPVKELLAFRSGGHKGDAKLMERLLNSQVPLKTGPGSGSIASDSTGTTSELTRDSSIAKKSAKGGTATANSSSTAAAGNSSGGAGSGSAATNGVGATTKVITDVELKQA